MNSEPWSCEERQRISRKLNELLAPETVNSRVGFDDGVPHYYLKIAQARALATDIFGSGHWHSEMRWSETDEELANGTYEIAVSCAVRVTLRDGTYREDIGFCVASGTSRAETMHKAQSIAATDATKRALRLFGPALGNCLYDPSFAKWLAANPTAA